MKSLPGALGASLALGGAAAFAAGAGMPGVEWTLLALVPWESEEESALGIFRCVGPVLVAGVLSGLSAPALLAPVLCGGAALAMVEGPFRIPAVVLAWLAGALLAGGGVAALLGGLGAALLVSAVAAVVTFAPALLAPRSPRRRAVA